MVYIKTKLWEKRFILLLLFVYVYFVSWICSINCFNLLHLLTLLNPILKLITKHHFEFFFLSSSITWFWTIFISNNRSEIGKLHHNLHFSSHCISIVVIFCSRFFCLMENSFIFFLHLVCNICRISREVCCIFLVLTHL